MVGHVVVQMSCDWGVVRLTHGLHGLCDVQAARALAAEDALRRWPPRAAAEAANGAAKRKSDEWSVLHEEDVI